MVFSKEGIMKKKLFVLFLAFAMVFAFAACGGGGESGGDEGTGSVYWLNYKPEADEALQGLAAAYTEETGVPVKVVTAASGSYSDTQQAEMAKSEPPTLFNVGNMSALKDWEDYCLPLDGTDFMNELTTNDFNLVNELFSYGIDINIKNNEGYPLIHFAVKNNLKMFKLLCEKGANIEAKDARGETILFVAARKNQIEAAKKFLLMGQSGTIKNSSGETPMNVVENTTSKYITDFTNKDELFGKAVEKKKQGLIKHFGT